MHKSPWHVLHVGINYTYAYSLVQWNWFSAVTGCTWVTWSSDVREPISQQQSVYACTTSTAFTLAPCWHQKRMHHIHSPHSCSFASAINNCKPTLPPLPLFLSSHSHTTTHFLHCQVTISSFFLGFAFSSLDVHCRNKITGHRPIGVRGISGLKRRRSSLLMLVR